MGGRGRSLLEEEGREREGGRKGRGRRGTPSPF